MYADHDPKPMKKLIDERTSEKLLSRYIGAPTKAQITEYSDLCNTSAKMAKQRYIVMHSRIEKLFAGKSVEFVLGQLNTWTHEASKHPNPGMIINARMKKYRERISQPSA